MRPLKDHTKEYLYIIHQNIIRGRIIQKHQEGAPHITLLGECKSLAKPADVDDMEKITRSVIAKSTPLHLGTRQRLEYVIFVPERKTKSVPLPPCITIVDGNQAFAALKDATA